MRAVIGAKAQVIELIVVLARQPLRAVGLLPDPFLKVVFQFLLAFASGQGLVLIDDEFGLAIGAGDFVVGGGSAVVEGVLDEDGGGEAGGAVGRGVWGGVFGGGVFAAGVPDLPAVVAILFRWHQPADRGECDDGYCSSD